MLKILSLALVSFILMSGPAKAADLDPANTIYMDLKNGRVVIKLLPELAPNHVKQIKTLVKSGFYNGIVFHRVLDGFMAQGGDPTGTGMGGSDLPNVNAEFSDYNFGRGTVGAARADDPNSANSQFYICFDSCSSLNGKYTVFAQVVSGMENVDKITRIDPQYPDPTIVPDKIIKMQMMEDAQ